MEKLVEMAATAEGRSLLSEGFGCLCEPLAGEDSGWDATFWLNKALVYVAMGNYPYPSSYILNGEGVFFLEPRGARPVEGRRGYGNNERREGPY